MKHGLNQAVEQCVARAAALVQQYPKRITAIIAALLVGGTGGTFAVANFAPDASDLPVRTVVETVQSDLLAARNEDISALAMRLYRSETTRSSDTADTLLKRLGVIDPQAAAYLRADAQAQSALLGRAGRNVTAEVNERQGLLKLSARWSPADDGTFKRLTIDKTESGFRSQVETLPLVVQHASCQWRDQQLAYLPPPTMLACRIRLQPKIAEIFSGDIDFPPGTAQGRPLLGGV